MGGSEVSSAAKGLNTMAKTVAAAKKAAATPKQRPKATPAVKAKAKAAKPPSKRSIETNPFDAKPDVDQRSILSFASSSQKKAKAKEDEQVSSPQLEQPKPEDVDAKSSIVNDMKVFTRQVARGVDAIKLSDMVGAAKSLIVSDSEWKSKVHSFVDGFLDPDEMAVLVQQCKANHLFSQYMSHVINDEGVEAWDFGNNDTDGDILEDIVGMVTWLAERDLSSGSAGVSNVWYSVYGYVQYHVALDVGPVLILRKQQLRLRLRLRMSQTQTKTKTKTAKTKTKTQSDHHVWTCCWFSSLTM